jgi:hypothetical protein
VGRLSQRDGRVGFTDFSRIAGVEGNTVTRSEKAFTMSLNLSFKLLPILAIALGVASLVVPRFLNIFVAIFLIVYGLVGYGFIR